jgi:hypothetical protein
MMKQSPTVTLSAAQSQPGMVLAEAVYDAQERLLIPQGTTLTQRHQRQMRQWGVESVTITAASAPEHRSLTPTPPPSVGELLQLDERDPFMRELAHLARNRYARHQQQATRPKEGSRT